MSALPIAKVKVAARKKSPTWTAVLLTDVVVGVEAAMAATDAEGVCRRDRSRVALFMVAPFMVAPFVDLRCKYTLHLRRKVVKSGTRKWCGIAQGGPEPS